MVELFKFLPLSLLLQKELGEELSAIREVLKQNPQSLNSKEFQDKIKTFVDRRIEEDRTKIIEKVGSINNILQNIGDRISDIAASSQSSSVKVQNIKNDLKNVNLNASSIDHIKKYVN